MNNLFDTLVIFALAALKGKWLSLAKQKEKNEKLKLVLIDSALTGETIWA